MCWDRSFWVGSISAVIYQVIVTAMLRSNWVERNTLRELGKTKRGQKEKQAVFPVLSCSFFMDCLLLRCSFACRLTDLGLFDWRTDWLSVCLSARVIDGPTDWPTDVPPTYRLTYCFHTDTVRTYYLFSHPFYVLGLLDLPVWNKAWPGKLGWAKQRCVLQRSSQLLPK